MSLIGFADTGMDDKEVIGQRPAGSRESTQAAIVRILCRLGFSFDESGAQIVEELPVRDVFTVGSNGDYVTVTPEEIGEI